MKRNFIVLSSLLFVSLLLSCTGNTYDLADYGLKPNTGEDASPLFEKAIESIRLKHRNEEEIIIKIPPGRYDFFSDQAASREYYISNHDQDNPKRVGLPFEHMKNVVFDGQGSELIFHGRMLPVSLLHTENCILKNFHIDFENPHISQVEVLENDTVAGIITFRVAPWVKYEIRDSAFWALGEGWEHVPRYGMAFEGDTKRIVYRTGDIRLGTRRVEEVKGKERVIKAYDWKDSRLIEGTVIAMRGPGRPTPGIFMSYNTNTKLENIQIHYAEGMGLLAQMCENITLDSFSVCLRGKSDPRYFTAQADATHFSGCKGEIISQNGLYENMMDDAINVHGTYLKVINKIDDRTLTGRYMHSQSYGFEWGYQGDTVQFINSRTMEIVGKKNRITSIQAIDKPDAHGAKEFTITFQHSLDSLINPAVSSFGIENLTWTPSVVFAHNTIRNNRARGALFSTPKPVQVRDNLFDYTSGSAILLCGDCNGWYESGACHDVTIRNNIFRQALSSMYQFTNAVISIFPVIPELENQKQYFHSNIVIEDNTFEYFDRPLVYAKSVDSLTFRYNYYRPLEAYPPYHDNQYRILLEHVSGFVRESNYWGGGFDRKTDIKYN